MAGVDHVDAGGAGALEAVWRLILGVLEGLLLLLPYAWVAIFFVLPAVAWHLAGHLGRDRAGWALLCLVLPPAFLVIVTLYLVATDPRLHPEAPGAARHEDPPRQR